MAVQIIGASGALQNVDVTSQAGRVILYDASGAVLGSAANPLRSLPTTGRTLVGDYSAVSFRTAGVAVANTNYFSFHVPALATVSAALKGIYLSEEQTTALLTVGPVISVGRTTAIPTGGTALAITKFRQASAASQCVALGSTASDGGGATAITATLSARFSSTFKDRANTLVGVNSTSPKNIISDICNSDRPLILAPGEGIAVTGIQALVAGDSLMILAVWEEYT